ncbi:MAG: 30S ribosomal protein S16 [Candidatus Eisenbacteria bacterium RBG_16_71_46]|nr:MAG: 30S ribosomal protein S16 [Candidatus Eisenbacteria bacterium RBG_16_71_46]OGF22976.1 MAG: 30S ribosomal protein S16 [Candidatus Eisenbacteria bacterium RBG_19FT_COMBO_70_11]
MSVVIRLMRAGAKKRPFYRMVAADSRRQRDGRFLEILGHYNPLVQPYELVVHKDKVVTWLSRGAQPSDQVASLLRSLGIPMHRPSPPRKKRKVRAEAPAGPKPVKAAKPAAKRAAPRKASVRKSEKKSARKVAKKKSAGKS